MKSKRLSLRVLSLSAGIVAGSFLSVANQLTVNPLISPLPEGSVARAETMMSAGNWKGAVDSLLELTTASDDLPADVLEKAGFLLAKALFLNGEPEALSALSEFCTGYPASVYASEARLLMADCFFHAGDFEKAAEVYQTVPKGALLPEQRSLYAYRLALSLLKNGSLDQAQSLFNSIRNDKEWRNTAKYYLAYIDLEKGDLDAAEKGFASVSAASDADSELAPEWYLAQIDFLRGNYAEAARKGEALLKNDRRNELARQMNRIVGLSLFKTGNLKQAGNYLAEALNPQPGENVVGSMNAKQLAEVIYALGVCKYEARDYEDAAEMFSAVSDSDSAVGQGALLYLGQCNVALGNNDAAALAFRRASAMDYDTDVTQAALFNYIASRTHGGNVPFATGIDLYNDFLNRFPDSRYAPQVRENLAAAYFNEKNFTGAISAINAIPSPSAKVLELKQKALYEQGRRLVASGNYKEAEALLAEGVTVVKPRGELSAECALWLGDARYALKNYKGAVSAYKDAMSIGLKGNNAALALYDLAYAYYAQDNYKAAATEFNKALDNKKLSDVLRADARVRLADCRYYTGDYSSAVDLYADALSSGAGESDYAAYRHAVMLGLGGNNNAKIIELSEFRKVYPDSRWNPDVLLELAQTYLNVQKEGEAVKALEKLVSSYPQSPLSRKGALMLGQALIRQGNTDKGEGYLRKLIAAFPASEEAALADSDLRNMHAEKGTLRQYADFLATVPGAPGLAPDEMESLQFSAAQSEFVDNPRSVKGLKTYLSDYPDGAHIAPALLMLAKNAAWYGEPADAVVYADRLLAVRPGASEALEALTLKAETLQENFPDKKNETLAAYRLLEKRGGADLAPVAYAGIMRNADTDKERLEYAEKLIRTGGLGADMLNEARMYRAIANLATGNSTQATTELADLAKDPNSAAGARAAVELAQYWLNNGNVSKAMSLLNDFTSSGTPETDWLAHGYLLMADGYRAQGNDYMAKQYLESLRDNYPGDDKSVISGIDARLKALNSRKKSK